MVRWSAPGLVGDVCDTWPADSGALTSGIVDGLTPEQGERMRAFNVGFWPFPRLVSL